jgi:ATP-binding cassette subfamily F protein uup
VLFDGLDLLIDRRERLGIVGPNGSGKSTLLDIVAGRRAPSRGHVDLGATVRVGYFDQTSAELDPAQRVRDAIVGPSGTAGPHEALLLERFWFDRDAQWAPIGTLSGGERRRLQLLLLLLAQPNVLLLDEPTNDLDLDTLRALEDFLDDWPGALFVVSHDRAFLERTVEEALVLDGRGRITRFNGGYAAWEAARRSHPADTEFTRPATRLPAQASTNKSRSRSTLGRLVRIAEKELAARQREREQLVREMDDAAGDFKTLARVGETLSAADAQLTIAEEHWLALATELESLD